MSRNSKISQSWSVSKAVWATWECTSGPGVYSRVSPCRWCWCRRHRAHPCRGRRTHWPHGWAGGEPPSPPTSLPRSGAPSTAANTTGGGGCNQPLLQNRPFPWIVTKYYLAAALPLIGIGKFFICIKIFISNMFELKFCLFLFSILMTHKHHSGPEYFITKIYPNL